MMRSFLFLILCTAIVQAQSKNKILPERYLRGYDPITVFLDKDAGNAGPLDDPSGVITMDPPHPGTYRLLDPRTLQFLPTVPWPALRRYVITAGKQRGVLVTFMQRPTAISPKPGARDLDPLRDIRLSFRQPIPADDLSRMVSILVRPLPGTEEQRGRLLTGSDFTIKTLERESSTSPAEYVVRLNEAIGFGHMATLQLKLTEDAAVADGLAAYHFSTKPDFTLRAVRVANTTFAVTAGGTRYAPASAADGTGAPGLNVVFSSDPGRLNLEQVKRLVRFAPAVKDLTYSQSGNELKLGFSVDRGRTYKVKLHHLPIEDSFGRTLQGFEDASLYFRYRAETPFAELDRREGLLERYGPKHLPMVGRGDTQVDLRVYKIDALDLRFWPFYSHMYSWSDQEEPAWPGEEPYDHMNTLKHLGALGSPPVSRLVDLPLNGNRASFGLDLAPHLADIDGKDAPGHYLVGVRRPSGDGFQRDYARVQITDLALSVVEEDLAVVFSVTSLKTGEPVADARVVVDGSYRAEVVTLIEGTTNARGIYRYEHSKRQRHQPLRIWVQKGADVLVQRTDDAPNHLINRLSRNNGQRSWLHWIQQDPQADPMADKLVGRLITERPVYKPQEPVHIKGWLKHRLNGALSSPYADPTRVLVVYGPGEAKWTYPLELTEADSFYLRFDEPDLPSGRYSVLVESASKQGGGISGQLRVSFRKEAYRIPRFEVDLQAEKVVPMDKPFTVKLDATYYAGGKVVGQPVSWDVYENDYVFAPSTWPDYRFSTQRLFSGSSPRESLGRRSQDVTNELGAASIEVDPSAKNNARPRRFVIQAEIAGADDQVVANTVTVVALPAFIIGVKLERFLEEGGAIKPSIIVLDHKGEPKADQEITVRLLHRQWHSYLRESDFTTGEARYVTDVVDLPLESRALVSSSEALEPVFEVDQAGVYMVEISARDGLGRLQQVTADLFVKGDTPMAWQKPKDETFSAVWSKKEYNPGERAELLLQSPFQNARALVVVNAPDRNRYHWVEVRGGKGIFAMDVEKEMSRSIQVQVLLHKSRGDYKMVADGPDLGLPKTLIAQAQLNVKPRAYIAEITLDHPQKALPGEEVEMKITMKDPDGNPLDGEVALWLVDRAVLALGREGRIDPMPSFVFTNEGLVSIRDTRQRMIGRLPFKEFPGGGGAVHALRFEEQKITVRKNFQTVPYFNPTIAVRGGEAVVRVSMPDNLTDFAVRAAGTDGIRRYGGAKSQISVRLPVIVQPALPRFVRPGDQFQAGGVGRVVEGPVGPGSVSLTVDGLDLEGAAERPLTFEQDKALQLYYPLTVTRPAGYGDVTQQVTVTMTVRRDADGAADAFELKLPVRSDRDVETIEQMLPLADGMTFAPPTETARAGTLQRDLLVSGEPAMIKMLAGLDYLSGYPHGCAEQRISRLQPELVLAELWQQLGRESRDLKRAMEDTLGFLDRCQDKDSGLYGFWPGSRTYVFLTARVHRFLTDARRLGYNVDPDSYERASRALQEALRSDYRNFLAGSRYEERTEALFALAYADQFDNTYAFELLARADAAPLEAASRLLTTMVRGGITDDTDLDRLDQELRDSVVLIQREGETVYNGLQLRGDSYSDQILASEVATLASLTTALHSRDSAAQPLRPLIDELINRGESNGWGSTAANAAAITALGTVLSGDQAAPPTFTLTADANPLQQRGEGAVRRIQTSDGNPWTLQLAQPEEGVAGLAWYRMRWVPDSPGHLVTSRNNGFVVEETFELYDDNNTGPRRFPVTPDTPLQTQIGQVVEVHVRVVNPEDRYYAAVTVPFAAGFEPLNPNLATAPKEATPVGSFTRQPDHANYADDRVDFYFDRLPKGTYNLYFRLRASFAGTYTHPAPRAELMYRQSTNGRGNATKVIIAK